MGECVSDEALTGGVWGRLTRGVGKYRWLRTAAEAGYDAVAWSCALLVAAGATSGLAGLHLGRAVLEYGALGMCALVTGCGLAAGLYRGRHRRGSREEVRAVMLAAALVACCLLLVGPMLTSSPHVRPQTVIAGAALALIAMLGGRYVAFASRLRSRRPAPEAVKIIVFGAGEAGAQLISRLTTQSAAAYRPVAILDDDPAKRRLRIGGVPVLGGRGQMAEVAASTGARVLVIAIAGETGKVIKDLTEAAERFGLMPKVVPSVRELLAGRAQIEGVRDPRISDLLGRRAVTSDVASVRAHIAGRRVLVTGAGGSIGAELCRQLHQLGPAQLIMLDRDESALHAVQLMLHGRALLDSEETVLADIRDRHRVREVFERFRPEIVFHAAALKHLPLLERCPAEAYKSNVLGTLTVLEAAADHDVRSFINISTDKAANPVSVLGYSKRITERLTADMSARAGGTFLSVRFGNVLGSRGSVLIALSAQVAAGGPVTVTDPEVSRYFMLADEAVHLVLQAAVIGRGGEVLVLDMGEPVRIADMARRMAANSGREVDIVFTGLRPGEKLFEDRLGQGENDLRPYHPLISQVPVPPLSADEVTVVDPDGDAGSLYRELARLAGGSSHDGARTIPVQSRATVPGPEARESGEAQTEQSGRPRSAVQPLGVRSSMRPAQLGQPGHRLVQQPGRLHVLAQWPAGRVGHIVFGRVAQQRCTLASLVSPRQPARERLTWRPGPDPLAPPDELTQRERTGPRPGLGYDGVPEIVPRHRQHQAGVSQVGGTGDAAAVRGDVYPVPGHDRYDLQVRRIPAAEHPGRSHPCRHAELGQPPGQQRGRHRRPANVGGAQHYDAVNFSHYDIAGHFSSFAFGTVNSAHSIAEFIGTEQIQPAREDITAPAVGVH
jgi:FlaA1/EpsC-like NDP-sugar epimerase